MQHRWWWVVVAGLIVFDRWLKDLALQGTVVDFGWPVFHLVRNYGLVFGIPLPGMAIIIVLAVVVCIFIVLWIRTRSGYQRLAIGLILVGAASNLFDRIEYGFVIDWADFGRCWPIFNLADVMIVTGLIMILFRHQLTKAEQ